MKTLRDFEFKNKRVLVRCDFNVPLDKEGNVLDDFRIRQTVPTIEYLLKKGAKLILMCHLDNPGGKVVENLKLTKVQEKLTECLDLSVVKAEDCVGPGIEKWTKEMKPGEILLLENLRFHREEEENDSKFAEDLSKLGDVYINDAFATSHRAHASLVGVPEYLPSAVGFLVEKELEILTKLIKNPEKPLVAAVGGKKVETKARLIDKLSETADLIIIGGLINRGIREKGITLKSVRKVVKPLDEIEEKDIGPKSIELFKEKIFSARTIFWTGPFGKIEEEKFQKGTMEIARAIVKSGAFSIIGGGETIEFINKIGLSDKFNYISTGGGALLDFICDGKLAAIEALNPVRNS